MRRKGLNECGRERALKMVEYSRRFATTLASTARISRADGDGEVGSFDRQWVVEGKISRGWVGGRLAAL